MEGLYVNAPPIATITRDTLVKVLGPDRSPCHGGSGQWPEPGEWHSVTPPVIPCEHGLHVCTVAQLITGGWLGQHIWVVEVDGERVNHDDDKTVVERARLIRELTTWNERTARHFAADCAESVIPIYERDGADGTILRDTIAVIRRYADGNATDEELAAARDAAWDATWDAAWAAARAATWDAARAAAWAAARAAARDAARDATWPATWAAARDAARDAAWDSQIDNLLTYMNGTNPRSAVSA